MANTTHTSHINDFDFVFVTEDLLSNYNTSYKRLSHADYAASVPQNDSALDRESLSQFHEEFKRAVLTANQEYRKYEEMAWEDTELKTPIEPHEIEWLDWRLEETTNVPEPPVLVAPQQAIKPMAGPRMGTPPAIETWLVKTIAVLIGLNMMFAGLIVSGTRIRDWFSF